MLQKQNGKRSVSFAGRLFMASCLFLMASIIYAHFSKVDQSDYVYAASQTQKSEVEIPTTPAPPPAPAPAPPPAPVDLSAQNNAALNAQIARWVQSQPAGSQWGIAVKGLANSSIDAGYGADTSFESASIYKLYMIYALAQRIPRDQWDATKVEGERTIKQCVSAMLISSDNPCGVAIGDKIGWSRAQANVRAAGYSHTVVNQRPITSTAKDTLKYLEDLYSGKTFTPQVRNEMLSDMRSSVFRQGIVAGCPGCSVANKTGNLNGYLHDVAIVQADGKEFALSIFSKGGSQRQIAAITNVIQQYVRAH